jgi:NTE family protein
MRQDLTLVCGGGGLWGAAWMIGLAYGLSEAGIEIRQAGTIIGTSAGSVAGSQLSSGVALRDLYARQTDPALQPQLLAPPPGSLNAMLGLTRQDWASQEQKLRAVCDLAKQTHNLSREAREAEVLKRLGLPAYDWPAAQKLLITAVDVETLALTVFSAASGVRLVDAVSASTAVPGVWPVTDIAGRAYVDGGVWKTAENAHLAAGAKQVLILAPMGAVGGGALGGASGLEADVAALREGGSEVVMIAADEASLRTMAPSPMQPETRKPAAEAGRAQARLVADQVRRLF